MTKEKMTSEDIIEHGRRLFQSVDNLRKSARDLVALNDSIHSCLKDLSFGEYEFTLDKSKDSDERNEWCRMAQSYDIDVKEAVGDKRKKQKLIGTITVITRLCDFEVHDPKAPNHPWNKQACIIVGWHKATEWESVDDEVHYWAIDQFDPENSANIHHCGSGLWAWKDDEDETEYAYFFALPIFAVTNEDALKRFALCPVKNLFDADDPKTVAEVALNDVPALLPPSK